MARQTIAQIKAMHEREIKNDYVSRYKYDKDVEDLKKQVAEWKERAITNEQYRGEARALSIVCDKLLFNLENPDVVTAYGENEMIRRKRLADRHGEDPMNIY